MAEEYTIMIYTNFALDRVVDIVSNASAVLPRMGLRFPFLLQNGLLVKCVVAHEFCVVQGEKALVTTFLI